MTRLAVFLGSHRVGFLEDRDIPSFAYEPAWLESAHACPLSRQLPLREEPFTGRPVRAFFAGLLPEAEVRERIAAMLGISAQNDFALLERLAGECAGAVSLWPEELCPPPARPSSPPSELRRVAWAEIIGQLPQRPLVAGKVRLSLAGAQTKLPVIVHPDDGSLALPADDAPSTHILKPEPSRFPGLAANEAFCMALARAAGLEAAAVRWQRIGGVPCLLVARYDRVRTDDGIIRRLHQEDFCQALGVPPERKYQMEGGPSLSD